MNRPLKKFGIILFFSCLFLALILHNLQGEGMSIWVPLSIVIILIAILAIIVISTMPAKKTGTSKAPFNWAPWKKAFLDILKYGVALLLIIFSVWYLLGHRSSYSSTPSTQAPVEKEKRWVLSWEAGPHSNERCPEMTSGEFLVTITNLDEETFNFVQHYENRRRARTAKFFGTRIKRPRLIYSGTWSQGRPGDDDYDHGEWVFEQVTDTKFRGHQTDSRGEEFQMELELR